jgi:hypothetical protein
MSPDFVRRYIYTTNRSASRQPQSEVPKETSEVAKCQMGAPNPVPSKFWAASSFSAQSRDFLKSANLSEVYEMPIPDSEVPHLSEPVSSFPNIARAKWPVSPAHSPRSCDGLFLRPSLMIGHRSAQAISARMSLNADYDDFNVQFPSPLLWIPKPRNTILCIKFTRHGQSSNGNTISMRKS